MPIVKSKPTSPGRRFVVRVVNPDLHKGANYKPLLEKKSKKMDQQIKEKNQKIKQKQNKLKKEINKKI